MVHRSQFFENKLAAGAVASVAPLTGTATRTTFATYTAPTVGAEYSQTEIQALSNAVQALSRAFKALTDDLRSRGVID